MKIPLVSISSQAGRPLRTAGQRVMATSTEQENEAEGDTEEAAQGRLQFKQDLHRAISASLEDATVRVQGDDEINEVCKVDQDEAQPDELEQEGGRPFGLAAPPVLSRGQVIAGPCFL